MEKDAPIVFAPKKDGTVRFYVDDCKLNAVMKRDLYPIPCLEEWMYWLCLCGCNFFNFKRKWQILVSRDQRKKSRQNHFYRTSRTISAHRYAVWVTQRLWNIPAYNWRHSLHREIAICPCKSLYWDEIAILSKSSHEDISHVRNVLTLLCNAGVTQTKEKSGFHREDWLSRTRYSSSTP